MNEKSLDWDDFVKKLSPPAILENKINKEWLSAVERIKRKIIVLDDDPTGVQTVHSIPVYTSWDLSTLRQIMKDKYKVIYILTNSRALTSVKTQRLHKQLARDLKLVALEEGKKFLLISRSDSTLRGHYPLETKTIYDELKKDEEIDGEIIIPFFLEGGRFTFNDIHYIKERDLLVPIGQTEFARDSVFGYKASNLKEWIEEKTTGQYPAGQVISISLSMLREKDMEGILHKLLKIKNFNKVIVNAVEYTDLKVFLIALSESINRGKNFLFRTAASFVRVIGGINPKPLLTKETLYPKGKPSSPGLIVIGSYVQKTTRQIKKLAELSNLIWVEWDVSQAKTQECLRAEVDRVISEVKKGFNLGKDVCIYTSREYYRNDSQNENSDKNLIFSSRISEGLVKVVQVLKIKPSFLVAKGGITSSDIGVKGLNVKRAMVMGQIQPGIPVWELGPESRFPGLPYIIFPGNVGSDDTLKKVVEILRK
ncbi:MAG: hydroxyacid dehydrogenase [Candidatus Atribacteria bacterium]|nr:hydroxyacid dehydrogenase [Candidatus Atribacteria bacterium]